MPTIRNYIWKLNVCRNISGKKVKSGIVKKKKELPNEYGKK